MIRSQGPLFLSPSGCLCPALDSYAKFAELGTHVGVCFEQLRVHQGSIVLKREVHLMSVLESAHCFGSSILFWVRQGLQQTKKMVIGDQFFC